MTVLRIIVEPEQIAGEIGSMTLAGIDELPFGAIKVDHKGVVLIYNRFEEKFANRNREDVVGRNFFSEVAPCTKVKAFHGAFEEGVRRRNLNEVFDFKFEFPTGSKAVRIRMSYATTPAPEGVWIFVTPMEN